MEVKQVEITTSCDWYRKGERHFVTDNPAYPSRSGVRWLLAEAFAGIQGAHAVELVGFRVWVRCRVKQLQLWMRGF